MRGMEYEITDDTEPQVNLPFSFQPLPNCDQWMYEGQYTVQVVLLLLALICVPLMLFPKPFIMRSQHRARAMQQQMVNNTTATVEENVGISMCVCV